MIHITFRWVIPSFVFGVCPQYNSRRLSSYYFPLSGWEKAKLVYKEKVFSGDVLSGKEALLAGLGISIDLSIHTCFSELQNGQLKQVLNGWTRQPWELSLIIARSFLSNTRLVEFARTFTKIEQKECSLRNLRNFSKGNDEFFLSC